MVTLVTVERTVDILLLFCAIKVVWTYMYMLMVVNGLSSENERLEINISSYSEIQLYIESYHTIHDIQEVDPVKGLLRLLEACLGLNF